jgi:hypothetical protein
VSAHASARDSKPGFLADCREGVEKIAGRARQPVKPRHRHHVAGVDLGQQAAKLRPFGLGSARHFRQYLVCAGRAKPADLDVNALAAETRA